MQPTRHIGCHVYLTATTCFETSQFSMGKQLWWVEVSAVQAFTVTTLRLFRECAHAHSNSFGIKGSLCRHVIHSNTKSSTHPNAHTLLLHTHARCDARHFCLALSMAVIIPDVLTAAKIYNLNEATIRDLIHWKNERVCTRHTPHAAACSARGPKCKHCALLGKLLVNAYHGMGDKVKKMKPEQAKMEVGLRLVYEAMYGIISVDSITTGAWFNAPRDAGHSTRIRRVWKRARGAPLYMRWIGSPVV